MTQAQILQSYRSLLRANPPIAEIERLLHLALAAPVLTDKHALTGSYRLPKIILCASLRHMAEKWRPVSDEQERLVKDLCEYLKKEDSI
ncbi:hypothetical protein [Olivibacter jilunii]|uniref:hypothetical protein n=1 Tax=Olivibacter jilunii TaxID=985016 RepID=UPI001030E87F|nr:hypothetical protein [Olivibacter jilunii]